VRLAPEWAALARPAFLEKKQLPPGGFKGEGALGYNDKHWNTSVFGLAAPHSRRRPGAGYCDPVQLAGDDKQEGFIFLEWSKTKRRGSFRYAIRPLFHIWNPDNVQWADIPFNNGRWCR